MTKMEKSMRTYHSVLHNSVLNVLLVKLTGKLFGNWNVGVAMIAFLGEANCTALYARSC